MAFIVFNWLQKNKWKSLLNWTINQLRCKTFYKIFIAQFDCNHFSLSTIRRSKNKAKSDCEKVSSYLFHESYLVILRDFIEDEKEMLKEVIVGWRKSLDMTEMEKDMLVSQYDFTYSNTHSFVSGATKSDRAGRSSSLQNWFWLQTLVCLSYQGKVSHNSVRALMDSKWVEDRAFSISILSPQFQVSIENIWGISWSWHRTRSGAEAQKLIL